MKREKEIKKLSHQQNSSIHFSKQEIDFRKFHKPAKLYTFGYVMLQENMAEKLNDSKGYPKWKSSRAEWLKMGHRHL